MSRKENGPRTDLYARITEKIVADLEKGVRPWVRPWSSGHVAGRVSRPLRHNGLPYQGINTLLLWSESVANGFASPYWMTFKQALELGGHVRKGESGTTVVYAGSFSKTETDANGEEVERGIPFLKAYTVFSADQIEELPPHYYAAAEPPAKPVERIEHADRFFDNTGAIVRYGGDKAFYSPSTDTVQLPHPTNFKDMASFVAIRAHETLHWTAAPHRLNRDLSRYHKDRSERAREELLVEVGSCLLCADLGIVPELEPRPDHASYLQSWLTFLGSDKRAIFTAAAHAQGAVAYLHDLQPGAAIERSAA
ncbi:ArdC family protein [Agrobacterium tumefaciens]|uniref:ArdC family protein n=1 Tax=Agrobacterium tumefaciens TaxID=358 RepID=UPI002243348B|nr:zincin-like metallopeptidase domain-containing protein [Agrobacterium tumefaciens]MCW8060490.1 zincin-like metallopeptidase domain-containing protein [Agrobacterium tumefaciens]MCW8145934.1 zincin-like metallopeptidase domain-containing protein [Agrobacterium tumefaciens]